MALEDQEWRPTCQIPTLRIRAAMLRAIRDFFDSRGFIEVETPLLSRDIVVDAHLHPFALECREQPYYLQTSPEAAMKRLLAAGSGAIYQITRSFRSGEYGQRHNPEFTIIEWYEPGTSLDDQILLTEFLVRCAFQAAAGAGVRTSAVSQLDDRRFDTISYDAVFRQILGESVLGLSAARVLQLAQARGLQVPLWATQASVDDLLNWILAEFIEPHFGSPHPACLTHYPVSQAALARCHPDDERVAERFELYFQGVELCNGYAELTDPQELQIREETQNAIRTANADHQVPGAPRLQQAMKAGLPPCSGVALGFDRLVMVAIGATSIRDVVPFPFDRA